MDASHSPTLTTLRRGAVCRLAGRPGRGIAVFQGLVWITQYQDSRDHFLSAGESFSFDRPGPVVVQAFTDATLLRFDGAGDELGDVARARPSAERERRPSGAGPIGAATAAAG